MLSPACVCEQPGDAEGRSEALHNLFIPLYRFPPFPGVRAGRDFQGGDFFMMLQFCVYSFSFYLQHFFS